MKKLEIIIQPEKLEALKACLLYTSDAADD